MWIKTQTRDQLINCDNVSKLYFEKGIGEIRFLTISIDGTYEYLGIYDYPENYDFENCNSEEIKAQKLYNEIITRLESNYIIFTMPVQLITE